MGLIDHREELKRTDSYHLSMTLHSQDAISPVRIEYVFSGPFFRQWRKGDKHAIAVVKQELNYLLKRLDKLSLNENDK